MLETFERQTGLRIDVSTRGAWEIVLDPAGRGWPWLVAKAGETDVRLLPPLAMLLAREQAMPHPAAREARRITASASKRSALQKDQRDVLRLLRRVQEPLGRLSAAGIAPEGRKKPADHAIEAVELASRWTAIAVTRYEIAAEPLPAGGRPRGDPWLAEAIQALRAIVAPRTGKPLSHGQIVTLLRGVGACAPYEDVEATVKETLRRPRRGGKPRAR